MYINKNTIESVVVEVLPTCYKWKEKNTLHLKQGKARTHHNRLVKNRIEEKIFSYIEKRLYPKERLKFILSNIYKRESWKKGIKTGVFSITKDEKKKIRESFVKELTEKGFLIK